MEQPYYIMAAKKPEVPIVVSVPHCGTAIPDELAGHYRANLIAPIDDTDLFVHRLYNFVPTMGITMIHAHYSRWVIDLNRSPDNQALYSDGRIITGLTPTTNFLGQPIYRSTATEPDQAEIERRKERYYRPYYDKITELLEDRKRKFGVALLWDAHSIRRSLPTIQPEPFPDMILGSNMERSAALALINAALRGLSQNNYQLSHNHPFRGGHITRYFGNPRKHIHALQLEMTKILYMDDAELEYDPERAREVRKILKSTFELLLETLNIYR